MVLLLLASCAHIPQPPFYGDPKEHPDWLKSKQVRDRIPPFSEPQNITAISYYYLKCQECGVVFKSVVYRKLCPECDEKKWWHINFKGRRTFPEYLMEFVILSPIYILIEVVGILTLGLGD
ncbi:MAG: hypothetical protein ACFFCW_41120 [Candidatus Hodarchaeota archaeon]